MPSFLEIPFELEVDCPATFQHMNYAAVAFDNLQGATAEQHFVTGKPSGGHGTSQQFVAAGKLIMPTGAALRKSDGVEMRRVWAENLTFARLHWNEGDNQFQYVVVFGFPGNIRVMALHASIPPRNGATLRVDQGALTTHEGWPKATNRPVAAWKPGRWMCGWVDTPHGDYLNFVAWGVRE